MADVPTDMVTVYRAADIAEADIVAAFLESHGIVAHVKDRLSAGTLQTQIAVAPAGIEVCVAGGEAAEQATALMRDHYRKPETMAGAGGTVEATCEDCGKTSTFPATSRGRVETCPHCRGYVDVPE